MDVVKVTDDGLADWSARLIVLIAVLNLNGVFDMWLGIGQVFSIVLFPLSILLIARCGHLAWSMPFALLVAAIVSYLMLGYAMVDIRVATLSPGSLFQPYIATILLLWAMAGYAFSLAYGPRLQSFLEFCRNALVAAAVTVWASPLLITIYSSVPQSAVERMSGFFGNPNEAGIVATLAVVFVLGLPYRHSGVQALALIAALGAVVLTLSKTAMSLSILVLAWHFIGSMRNSRGAVVAILAIVAVAFVVDLEPLVRAIGGTLGLQDNQMQRLLAVGKILSGELDEDISTGRTELWVIGLERAWANFPLGSGLGSYHFLKGGIFEGALWLGVHNTFLLFLGEAGILPATILVLAFVAMLYQAWFFSRGSLELLSLIVMMGGMVSTHGALVLRYNNVILAVMLGLLGYAAACAAQVHRSRPTENAGTDGLPADLLKPL